MTAAVVIATPQARSQTHLLARAAGTAGTTSVPSLTIAPREINFTLPSPTMLLNPWQRMHWRARGRYMRNLAYEIFIVQRPPKRALEFCQIQVWRHCLQLPDWDALYGGVKPLLDCLVVCTKRNPHGLGFIRDDSPTVIRELIVLPVYVPTRKQECTVVRIRETRTGYAWR